jgi:putative ABC transport system permease protein
MSYLLRMALRNTLRNHRRSALTLLAIFLGVGIFVLAQALIAGIERTMIGTEVDSEQAHLRVMSRAFAAEEEFFPVEHGLPDVDGLEAALRARHPGVRTARRSSFSAQVGDRTRSLTLRGIAVEPESYTQIINFGTLAPPPAGAEHWMWLGADVAAAFDAKPGQLLTLAAKTRSGTRNALTEVTVAGVIATGHPIVDNFSIVLPQRSADELLDTSGGYATELLARFVDADEALAAKAQIEQAAPAVLAETWREKTEYIIRFNDVRRIVFNIFTLVIMLMAAAGVANTTLMSGFERITEIGALLALGLSRRRVMGLFLIEATVLGLVGVVLGLLAGGLPAAYLERHGLHIGNANEMAGTSIPVPPILYLDLTPATLTLAAVLGFGVALVAAAYPAWKLSRTDPIYALKVEG